jgi:hypothetical protein
MFNNIESYSILEKLCKNKYDVILLGGTFVDFDFDINNYKLKSRQTATGIRK